MAGKRSYAERCGIARALDVVGERWALLVVRELLLGPKRFADLRAALPGLSADILTQRLRDLEAGGLVARRTLEPPAAARVYELTDRGRGLEDVVLALGRWGSVEQFAPGAAPLGPDAFVVALKSWFAPAAAARAEGRYGLRLDGQSYRADVAAGRFDVHRGEADDAEATIAGDPGALAAVLWHGAALAAAEARGAVEISGSRRAARSFLKLFPMPA